MGSGNYEGDGYSDETGAPGGCPDLVPTEGSSTGGQPMATPPEGSSTNNEPRHPAER